MADAKNVLGGRLQVCGADPMTGFYRDGLCAASAEDPGVHTLCCVMTSEFLEHQRAHGNDLVSPVPSYRFPGLKPGDRWCVVARRWLQAAEDGVAAPVVLACSHERTLEIIPMELLRQHAVDVPDDPRALL